MSQQQPKVLFILHIPPPVNGAAMMGKYLMDSELINSGFDADYINLSSSSSLDAIGKGGVGKILAVAKIHPTYSYNEKDCFFHGYKVYHPGF